MWIHKLQTLKQQPEQQLQQQQQPQYSEEKSKSPGKKSIWGEQCGGCYETIPACKDEATQRSCASRMTCLRNCQHLPLGARTMIT